jgi:hypothetical protein
MKTMTATTTTMMIMMIMATTTSLMELLVVDIQIGFHPFQVSVVTQCVVPLTVVRIML